MPEISRFFGIIIAMFFDEHNPPHFHARYGKDGVAIEVRTLKVLEGRYHLVRWGWSSNGLLSIRRSCFKTGSWHAKTSA